MGCKQSKYSDGQEFSDEEHFKGDGGMYGSELETEIIASRRYMGGGLPAAGGPNSLSAQVAAPQPALSHAMCNDAHFTTMAEGCTSGILDMFSLGNGKMITNEPAKDNAYQQPAYNYQAPESDRSLGANSQTHSAHSQNSQRRAVAVRNGSFNL